jgi:endoglucanase
MPMRRMNPVLSLVMVVVLAVAMFATSVTAAADEIESRGGDAHKNDLQAYVDQMQPGWNLGNTFDAIGSDETAWGNPRVTKEFFHELAKQGFRSVRIPITWMPHMGGAPDYKIDSGFLDRTVQVVDWALDEGLYVMINMHHDSSQWVMKMGTDHGQVVARYSAAWTQIADRFKNHSTKLMFESINEPRFSGDWNKDDPAFFSMLDELNTMFHKIVRESGGKNEVRPIVLPALTAGATQTRLDELNKTISKLNDPHLIVTFHYYGYWPFSVNIAGATHFDDKARNDLIQTFDRVSNTFVAKGIPVILGEFGLLGFDIDTSTIEQGEKLKYFEFLSYYAKEKRIMTMLWDNGQHFNRLTYEWRDPELYDILEAGWKGRSSTAETDLIYVQKGAQVQDTAIRLNMNGNSFASLEANSENLHRGSDYSINGDVLTVKANLLNKLTVSGKLGENAVLTAKFNQGADWHLHVLYADTPQLQSAQGTTEAFAIPAAFNGDHLATIESVYPDGSNAGPQSWTPYKQFGSDFRPSYDANEIKLLPAFFNEVKDGLVILKFHFWSGKIVTYTITKTGTSVTGTAY